MCLHFVFLKSSLTPRTSLSFFLNYYRLPFTEMKALGVVRLVWIKSTIFASFPLSKRVEGLASGIPQVCAIQHACYLMFEVALRTHSFPEEPIILVSVFDASATSAVAYRWSFPWYIGTRWLCSLSLWPLRYVVQAASIVTTILE